MPSEAYLQIEEVNEAGEIEKKFKHIPSSVGVHEMEAVGVEHLLRDIKDVTEGSLVRQISNKVLSLNALVEKLQEISNYLSLILNKSYPINSQIISNLQEIVNLLPNLSGEKTVRSFSVKTNEVMQTIYVTSIVRTIMALHKLINNKIDNKRIELNLEKMKNALANKEEAKKEEDKKDEKKDEPMEDAPKDKK